MNLSRKTVMLVQFAIVPISSLAHGLIALLLCSMVQSMSGHDLGVAGFAIPTVVMTGLGGLGGWMRLGETEFE